VFIRSPSNLSQCSGLRRLEKVVLSIITPKPARYEKKILYQAIIADGDEH
jgi:hypothetical protein